MEELTPIGFLDVPVLLDASQPRPGMPWIWLATATSVGLMIVAAISGNGGNPVIQLTASALAVGIFLFLPLFMRFAMKQVRAEQSTVAAAVSIIPPMPTMAYSASSIL